MFEAQYLFNDDEVYSPWMPRQGDNMIITVELITNNSSSVTIEVYQKNSEQTGEGFAFPNEDDGGGTPDPAQTVTESTAGNRESGTYTGVMELVRYKIIGGGSSAGDRILFRMLPIVWFDDVKA